MRTAPLYLQTKFVRKEERAFSESNAVLIRVHDSLFAYGAQSGEPMVRYDNPKEGIGHCCWYYLNCAPKKGLEAFLVTYEEATGRQLFRSVGNPLLRSAARNAKDLIPGLTDRTFMVGSQVYEHFLDLSGILMNRYTPMEQAQRLETVRDSLSTLAVGGYIPGVFGEESALVSTRFKILLEGM